MQKVILLGWAFALGMCSSVMVWAEDAPRIFTYAGKYVSSDGTPMPDGVYDLLFALYETPVDGAPVWTELHRNADKNGVQVSKGKFEVVLGNLVPLPEFEKNYWIGVSHPATGQQLVPREQLASVPYALNGVPKGAIIIWRGATCPIGYKRVDFLGGFIRDTPASETVGMSGGSESHSHSMQYAGEHAHHYKGTTSGNSSQQSVACANCVTVPKEGHNHSFENDTWSSGNHKHVIDPAGNLPPYINVIFCEKE